jgi:hypothetical protein
MLLYRIDGFFVLLLSSGTRKRQKHKIDNLSLKEHLILTGLLGGLDTV